VLWDLVRFFTFYLPVLPDPCFNVELAGEIRDFHPSAELTVVQKDRLPLNATYPDALRQRIATELNARGVRVILDDTVQLSQAVLDGTDSVTPGRKITTARGTTIPAEFIVRSSSFPMTSCI
jgi:hypothetical protein